jgi:hypothetical protein
MEAIEAETPSKSTQKTGKRGRFSGNTFNWQAEFEMDHEKIWIPCVLLRNLFNRSKLAFAGSGLLSIHISSSVEVICQSHCSSYVSLASVTFAANSRLSRLKKRAFYESGVVSIHLPASLEVICDSRFLDRTSLASVTFEANPRLSRLENGEF